MIYSDALVDITDKNILFKNYSFFDRNRSVFSRHRKIVIKKPSVRTGKFRFHGTGDFHAWFAKDFERHKHDGMFIAFIRRQWWRIGFTVERSDAVMKIFQERGLIRPAGKHPLLTNRKKVCR